MEVAGKVLEALLEAAGPAKLVDIARTCAMPSAKVHRYLVSLARCGLALQDPRTGRYDLGPLAMRLGLASFSRFDPLRAAEVTLGKLAAEVGETCAIAVWDEGGPSIVRVAQVRHVSAGSVALGHRCPLTWSATGIAFCAFGPEELMADTIAVDLEQSRATGRLHAPHDLGALAATVTKVRGAGLATNEDGGGEGRAALAVPVFDASGSLAMVLTVFGRLGRIDTKPDGSLATIIKKAAAQLSELLGYRASII